jgi:hypothetical protein
VGAALIVAAAGVVKEISDGKNNSPKEHALDLLADAAGIGLAALSVGLIA